MTFFLLFSYHNMWVISGFTWGGVGWVGGEVLEYFLHLYSNWVLKPILVFSLGQAEQKLGPY